MSRVISSQHLRLNSWALVFSVLFVATGCGTDATDTPASTVIVDIGPSTDVIGDGIQFSPTDTGSSDGSDVAVSDVAVSGDGSPTDTAGEAICTSVGGFGCLCKNNDECDTGFCVQGPQGKVCTRTCLDSCPSGFKCVQTGEGGDLTYLCAPTTTSLCQPCEKDKDCNHVGASKGSAACLPVLNKAGSTVGSFCSAPCGGGVACPTGFNCKVLDLATGSTEQCVPESSATCACNAWGVEKKASTTCSRYSKIGTCWGARQCTADGLGLCSAATPTDESCNQVDDDCDGETDEGFMYDDGGTSRPLTAVCGVGSCLGGKVTCKADGSGTMCTTANNGTTETCNLKDDDCDGEVDEGMTVADSDCLKVGVCASKAVKASCEKGQWLCDFSAVSSYSAATETLCDGLDNDCDGQTDEHFSYDGVSIGAPCQGLGGCGKGVVVCASTKTGATCSTNPVGPSSEATLEKCDDIDNDCDGITDEGCDDDKDGYCDATMIIVGTPKVCTKTGVDCDDESAATNLAGTEICNDKDDNCDGAVDEGCDDDKDGYCDENMIVIGSPKVCSKGAGDCNDAVKSINASAKEICDTKAVDENCNGTSEEENALKCKAFYLDSDKDSYGESNSTSRCLCKPDPTTKYTSQNTTDCDDKNAKVNPKAQENCATNYDDNCNKAVNDINAKGCKKFYFDKDEDSYGDAKKAAECRCQAIPSTKLTATNGKDCVDSNKLINPSMQENCATPYDDNCNNNNNDISAYLCTKYYKDSDGDGYGAKGSSPACMCVPNTALKFTALKAQDCDDGNKNVKPGVLDTCATPGIDDNCDGKTDEEDSVSCKKYFFDFDGDGYGVGAPRCLCSANKKSKFSAKTAGDCNDNVTSIRPNAVELCNGIDDDCDNKKDDHATASCKGVSKATVQCVTPTCKISGCAKNYFDLDKKYATGCECKADANYGGKGNTCSNAIIGATLIDTAKKRVIYTGNLMPGETGQWYRVYTKDAVDVGGCDSYDTRIRFTQNPGNIFQMDVYRGSCTATSQMCKDEVEHRYRVDFRGVAYGVRAKPAVRRGTNQVTPKPVLGGECKCSGNAGKNTSGLGFNRCTDQSAMYYVRVHYKTGVAPVCANFSIEFSNAYYK